MKGERKRGHMKEIESLCNLRKEHGCVSEVNKETSVKINETNRGPITSDQGKEIRLL